MKRLETAMELIIKAEVLIKIDVLEGGGVVVRALEFEVLDSRLETLVELLLQSVA